MVHEKMWPPLTDKSVERTSISQRVGIGARLGNQVDDVDHVLSNARVHSPEIGRIESTASQSRMGDEGCAAPAAAAEHTAHASAGTACAACPPGRAD